MFICLKLVKGKRLVPSVFSRTVFVLLQVLPMYLLRRLLIVCRSRHPVLYNRVAYVNDNILPIISRCHLALFLLDGKYPSIANHFCGIHYGFLSTAKRPVRRNTFLAGILLLQSIVSVMALISKRNTNKRSTYIDARPLECHNEDNAEGPKCLLCLGVARVPTATVCGHIFCWECILQWLAEDNKPSCPTCRSLCLPQQLLPIYHFG